MSIVKILLNEIKRESSLILYHGTEREEYLQQNIDRGYPIFFSKDQRFSESYGDYIFKCEIVPVTLFDSMDLNDIKVLYEEGFQLYDEYLDGEFPYMSDKALENHYLSDYYKYDEDKNMWSYQTAEDFYNASNLTNNTWEAIEHTDGVVSFILGSYDGMIVYEDGIINYCLPADKIKNYTLVKQP